MAKLDIMYRMFHYYDKKLNQPEKKLEGKKYKFSSIYPKAVFTNKADEEFILKSEYILNEKFKDQDGADGNHIFKKFDEEDWDNFFLNSHYYLNLKSGIGFDSVVFDGENTITFHQDKYRRPEVNDTGNSEINQPAPNQTPPPADPTLMKKVSLDQNDFNQIKNTSQNCQKVFEDILSILYSGNYQGKYKIEGLKWRLVFRTLWNPVPEKKLENIKVKCIKNIYSQSRTGKIKQFFFKNKKQIEEKNANLIFIGLNEFEDEFEGVFDLKLQFFRQKHFNNKTDDKSFKK
jgi:hypothetical protein